MLLRARLPVAVAISFAAIAPGAAQAFSAHGSARQVYATGLPSKAQVSLLSKSGRKVATKRADGLGGVLFRNVTPGSGYRVRLVKGGGKSGKLTVFSNRAAPPSTDVYNQTLPTSGYGYMTTRDGTKLALDVHPPSDITNALPVGVHLPRGAAPTPSPTLIEYSGYGYANPAGPVNGIAILANLMGFTVVDVNMRGTGCSGGAFDFFEPLQNLDGYDVIETVARQPWVLNHKVGMMGISYGGISQLFTAQLRPPSLAAISPLSVIDQTATTLYPGGILNTGFAVAWAKERQQEAKPAGPHGGQPYAYKQIQGGDAQCKANQVLHGEAANLMAKIRANDHYVPKVADPLSPITFVHKINVPVFMACQFTDEQTGGHCPTLAEHMTGTTRKWFTYTNGTHVDSLDPQTFNRWFDFLQLYVAKQAPFMGNPATYRGACPVIYQEAMGVPGQTCPPDPIQNQPTYAGALAAFEALPSIRVMFDNGAGGNMPGAPEPGFEQSFSKFPVPGTSGRSFFFASGGKLAGAAPAKAGTNSFTWNAHARPLADFSGDTGSGSNGLWTATPPYKWLSPPAGTAASYVTAPLTSNTTVVGAGAVHVWVRASKPIVDLQATVTEVRPDGKETFVQNGWLRGNERKLDARKSTPLEPVLTLRKGDRKPLSPKRYVQATIPLYYEGHVYRAGSRIRVYITAPNGDQPIWSFSEPKPSLTRKASVSLAFSKSRPSRLVLPVVAGVNVPTGLPPCPGLRGEPCRDYKPYKNRK
jgi:predicted acyl esterase